MYQSIPYEVIYNYLEGCVGENLTFIIRNWFIIYYMVIIFRILHSKNYLLIILFNDIQSLEVDKPKELQMTFNLQAEFSLT